MKRADYAAQRLAAVKPSPVRKAFERAQELEAQGHRMVFFQIGEPDFNTPQAITDGTLEALKAHQTHYCANRGVIQLRRAIAEKLKATAGLHYDPEGELLVTVGGEEAISVAVWSFVDPGDEVIIVTPAFMSYRNLVVMAEGVPVFVPARPENKYQPDPQELLSKVTSRTKMVMINNPCNPTGAVWDSSVLEQIAQIAREKDLLVFSDEIYDQIVYDGVRCRSIASFEGMKERTLVVNGFSKTYAMTGWRMGYIATAPELMAPMVMVHQYNVSCLPTFTQLGVASAMLTPQCLADVDAMVDAFRRKRELIVSGLQKVEPLSFLPPRGAFYLWIDVSATGLDGVQFSQRLLEEHFVATVAGVAFADDAQNFIRISFATSEEDIALGVERIASFVKSL